MHDSVQLDGEELVPLARQDIATERFDEALLKLKQAITLRFTPKAPFQRCVAGGLPLSLVGGATASSAGVLCL